MGLETVNSNPSLLIVSIRTPICSSPLPLITKESLSVFSSKVIATFVSASAISLSLITVEVTLSPSVPPKGESLTVIVTDIVGGSIGVELKGSFISGSQIVSATDVSFRPARQTKSPAEILSLTTFLVPSNPNNFVNLPFSIILPSKFIALTFELTLTIPCSTLPIKHLPKYGSLSNNVTIIANGLSVVTFGGST